jgi:type IV pilus assembly protein PilF
VTGGASRVEPVFAPVVQRVQPVQRVQRLQLLHRFWKRQFACLMLLALVAACATNKPAPGDLQTSSDQTDIQRRAQIRLQLAVGYFEQGQMATALDEVKQALQIDPNLADGYSVRALVYMEMGETRLAEENFQRALKIAPNNPDFSNNYGWFLCHNGQEKQSIGYFDAALQNKSYLSPAKALNNAGLCSMRMKDNASAERYLLQAFRLQPNNPDTNLNLAKLAYSRNDLVQSQFYISRVARGEAPTPDVLWTAIKVERKRGDLASETRYASQLRRRYPNSPEYAAFLRGAFNE